MRITKTPYNTVACIICVTAAPHHTVFYRPDALPAANQQRQSTEGLHATK